MSIKWKFYFRSDTTVHMSVGLKVHCMYLFHDVFSSVNSKTFDRDHLVCCILLIILMATLTQHQSSFNHFTNGIRTTHHQTR